MGQIDNYEDLVDAIDRDGIEATVKAHRKPPLHTRILRELYDLYLDQPKYVEFLANYPLIPSDLAERIAQEADPAQVAIARGLASNPRSSQPTLNHLSTHEITEVRCALAANPNLTPKECQALAEDENHFVRATLATNPALPTPLQFILSADAAPSVRAALAGRKTLDPDIAVHLGQDSDPVVRNAIIHHWTQDPELLHLWAEQDDALSQQLLLRRNKALEPALLETLRLSPHAEIRQDAVERSQLTGAHMLWLAESDNLQDRLFLAEQTDLPASIQRLLAHDSAPKVRRRLAANTCIDAGIALHIASSDDLPACRVLAKNPAIQDACIAQLCTHPDDHIALLVAYRDDLGDEHRDLLLNQRNSNTVAEHLAYQGVGYRHIATAGAEELARSPAPSLRRYAAQSAHLERNTFQLLSKDSCDTVRHALASNGSTPEACLRTLLNDSNRETIFAAEETLAKLLRNQQMNTSEETPAEDNEPHDDIPNPFLNKIINFFTE